jgi:hypothetical protein
MRGGSGDVSERPIIFGADMVQAILAGRKTMTRRLMKQQEALNRAYRPIKAGNAVYNYAGEELIERARFAVGDRLWVRETWQTGSSIDGPQLSYRATPDFFSIDAWDGIDYGAGPSFNYARCPGARWDNWLPDVISNDGPWRSPIHMPRWASRLKLSVTEVRVERLQDISDSDAFAEGVGETEFYDAAERSVSAGAPWAVERLAFANLWGNIHGQAAWDLNPWVAAVCFTVESPADVSHTRGTE